MGKLEDINRFEFILDAIRKDSSIVRLKCFGRAFSFYMLKCPQETLDRIADVIKPHVLYLLNDSYGNYLLQIFYDRQCSIGVDMCQDALRNFPKKALMRKYCRYVLYKGILHDTDGSLSLSLIGSSINDIKYLQVVLTQRQPRAILLLALSRLKDHDSRIFYAQSILRLSSSKDLETRKILIDLVDSSR